MQKRVVRNGQIGTLRAHQNTGFYKRARFVCFFVTHLMKFIPDTRADFCIAPRLKKSREAAGLSQINLAKILFVPVKKLRLWERGDIDIPFQMVINWSYATGAPFEYLCLGRLPLKHALAKIKEARRANDDAITLAYRIAHASSKEMEMEYVANWAATFENYS